VLGIKGGFSLGEPYLVKLEVFEGPLDLLLHLIKKNEVSIYDIPVSVITEQYIEYLELMKELNLEIAGEYLVMAAELGLIKSKMLLPRQEIEEQVDQCGDPREELVRRLIEYKRYKDAAYELFARDILGRDVFSRDDLYEENEKDENSRPLRVDLWSLIEAFKSLCERRGAYALKENEYIWFEEELVSVEEKMEEIIGVLRGRRRLFFEELFKNAVSKIQLILTFLALLEVIRAGFVVASQDLPYGPIELCYVGEG